MKSMKLMKNDFMHFIQTLHGLRGSFNNFFSTEYNIIFTNISEAPKERRKLKLCYAIAGWKSAITVTGSLCEFIYYKVSGLKSASLKTIPGLMTDTGSAGFQPAFVSTMVKERSRLTPERRAQVRPDK